MAKCKECGSMAINHHCHGRDGSDGDLCDVCYWQKRATEQAAVIEQMRYGLEESLEVAYGEFGPGAMSKELEQLIALQPCPEVLNKVRAEAVRSAKTQLWLKNEDYAALEEYAQRIEKGEA